MAVPWSKPLFSELNPLMRSNDEDEKEAAAEALFLWCWAPESGGAVWERCAFSSPAMDLFNGVHPSKGVQAGHQSAIFGVVHGAWN